MSATSPDRLEVGVEIPPFERAADFANWNRYAAVNDEFIPLHMDDEVGRQAGYPGAIGMGNLQWAYLHNMLELWLDGAGHIVSVKCQFRTPVLRGASIKARGVISEIREKADTTTVNLDVWVEDADGRKLIPGQATVALTRQ